MNTIALFARRAVDAPLCGTVSLLLATTFAGFAAGAAAPSGPADALARELVRRAEMTRGVCAVLGGEGELARGAGARE